MTQSRPSRWSMEWMNIDSFGKLRDASVGPFAPGMNVVFGKNESGKTTLSSFVTGVLFGWPDGRSRQNTYKAENAERSGRLLFRSDDGRDALLGRTRNADGVEDAEGLLADIDGATYRTVFALDGDALLSLDEATAVTSQLLTAGSGTAASPVHALRRLDERIAGYTSRSATAEHSIVNLSAQLEAVGERINQAEREASTLIAESREYEELGPARAELSRQRDELNALIEGRSADLSLVHKLENQLAEYGEQQAELDAQLARIGEEERRVAERRGTLSPDVAALRDLDALDEQAIRDALEDFQAESDRLANAVDFAKRDLADSRAAYEVLEEYSRGDAGRAERSKAAGRTAASAVLPVFTLLAGVFAVVHGASAENPAITGFGVLLAVAALALGAASVMVALRSSQSKLSLERRLEDARWAMLQDQKKLAACESEYAAAGERIASYLRANHLSDAGGSLRRARSMLDVARDLRAMESLFDQQRQAAYAQRAVLDDATARSRAQRDELLGDAGVPDIAAFEALVSDAIARRDRAIDEAERMDTRYGELAQRLSQGRAAADFAALKQKRASLRHRLEESKRDFACLLLARRNLADAIAEWESKSQPEVYQLASRLFADMTDGAWAQVRLSAAGDVQVASATGDVRDPMLLSLGTRQQLYLSLRIALLMKAGNVGQAAPVLADDILVNFDAQRRRHAARALLELAGMRQVLLFTCHEEVVSLIQELDSTVNVLQLS